MTNPCLHCAIWEVIRDHARQNRSVHPVTGVAVCGREAIATTLTSVMVDVLLSGPSSEWQTSLIDEVAVRLRAHAGPGAEQPRADIELVSWQ